MSTRDEFSQPVKETLAKRVGCRCSSPSCQKLTSGPHEDPKKSVNIGVAAHITAAAPGGKRYDPRLSSEERSAIGNGIWLCQNCGKLIDSNEQKYPVALLFDWKRNAEQWASSEIENTVPPISQHMASSTFEKYLKNLVDTPQSWWLDAINESTWYEFELFTKVQKKSDVLKEQPKEDKEQPTEDKQQPKENKEQPKENKQRPKEVIKPILEALQNFNGQKILISGIPGTGKSTLLEKIAVEAAHKALKDDQAPFPVLIKLKNYQALGDRPGIRGLIQASLETYGLSLGDEAATQLPANRLLLLIDGWNELSDVTAKSSIKDFCKPYSVIATSRNQGDWSEFNRSLRFSRFYTMM